MFNFTVLPPLGLYIHFPWCVRKCPYCDFSSHEQKDEFSERKYIDALLNDLDQELPQIWGRTVESVFIGGGTPSLMSAEGIDRLLSELRARLALTPEVEITLEANPGTAEQEKFSEYRQAGINRRVDTNSFARANVSRQNPAGQRPKKIFSPGGKSTYDISGQFY